MALSVKDVNTLQGYVQGVMQRAEHHARGVDEVVLAIAGAIVWKKDDARDLEVMLRDGDMKNVLWVWIAGVRYAFSFNHVSGEVEVRKDSVKGAVVKSLSNTTPLAEVKEFFAKL